LYEVVADVKHYKEFVPWCQRSVVTLKRDNYMEAELEVGFRVFVERYTSLITLQPGQAVHSQVGAPLPSRQYVAFPVSRRVSHVSRTRQVQLQDVFETCPLQVCKCFDG
jgi:hypothetical protein